MNLIPITDNLWTTSQPLCFLGIEVGARMTVIRLNNDDLVLISPISLWGADCLILDDLGTVRHIIAPNLFHHLFIAQAQTLYPQATVWGVEGLSDKRPDLKFDALLNRAGTFSNELDYFPFEGFEAILPRGIMPANETVFYHRPSRTLILTDIAFNFDQSNGLGTQLAARVIGSYNSLKPSRMEKWGTRNKGKVEASIRQVLAWDFDRVIPAHGSIVETNGKSELKEGYEWFLNRTL
ncbi:MAG: DUF4336 domain-containing protein [Leptolyngbya sp. SIO1D8]|nr:DUF4336 domain-containing protein [Leptolyngbya sp. SIO1D8]